MTDSKKNIRFESFMKAHIGVYILMHKHSNNKKKNGIVFAYLVILSTCQKVNFAFVMRLFLQ